MLSSAELQRLFDAVGGGESAGENGFLARIDVQHHAIDIQAVLFVAQDHVQQNEVDGRSAPLGRGIEQADGLGHIDGNGNRVAAMIYGPSKVIVVAGRNKIVEGDVGDAIRRIKDKSAPPNAMRLGKQTPCAATGFCCDCDAPQRICHVTTIIDSKPSLTDFHVLVVNEDMGL